MIPTCNPEKRSCAVLYFVTFPRNLFPAGLQKVAQVERLRNMNTEVIEVNEVSEIVLTKNGKPVGLIRVENFLEDSVRFVGSAINLVSFTPYEVTVNGFACTGAISTDTKADLVNAETFLAAYKAAK